MINCYPLTGALNTGSVDAGGNHNPNQPCELHRSNRSRLDEIRPHCDSHRGYCYGVVLNFYVNTTNWPYFDISQVTNDPLTASGATLWSEINAEANIYLSYTGSAIPTGWNAFTLTGNANTDVQSLIGAWWAVGCLETDCISTYYWTADGWNEANMPYITVTYCTGPVDRCTNLSSVDAVKSSL